MYLCERYTLVYTLVFLFSLTCFSSSIKVLSVSTKLEAIRCGYTRPLAHREPWGYGLGWVYPGLCSTARLRLHACKLPKGMVSVDLFRRETYLHVNMEDLNDELFSGLISVIVKALLLIRQPQLSSAIQRFILRRPRRRRLQSRFLQSLQLSHLYFRRRLAAAQTDFHFCAEQR